MGRFWEARRWTPTGTLSAFGSISGGEARATRAKSSKSTSPFLSLIHWIYPILWKRSASQDGQMLACLSGRYRIRWNGLLWRAQLQCCSIRPKTLSDERFFVGRWSLVYSTVTVACPLLKGIWFKHLIWNIIRLWYPESSEPKGALETTRKLVLISRLSAH